MKYIPSISGQATGDKWGEGRGEEDNQEKSDFL